MLILKYVWWAFRYAWLSIRHKWFVLLIGRQIGCSYWRLICHDLSKFGPSELFRYGRQFFGDKADALGFSYAWLHHQRVNKHHWEYWIPVTGHNRGGNKDLEPLPMPKRFALEMVADWMAASRAYEGRWPEKGKWSWFDTNYPNIRLHPQTQELVSRLVDMVLSVRMYKISKADIRPAT